MKDHAGCKVINADLILVVVHHEDAAISVRIEVYHLFVVGWLAVPT
jgi:hypothetical protein